MRDSHFNAALSEGNSPILQRRSGKAQSTPKPVNRILPLEDFPSDPDTQAPEDLLESGKLRARALAGVLDEAERLTFARSFCSAVIATYWFAVQRKYPAAWPLPAAFSSLPIGTLDEPAASLAKSMGEAATRLGPLHAIYLMGVTYTALLPDDTRSRLGVYYTPPGLSARLLEMATRAGVDWRACRVLDPACGGGAFLAPVAARMVAENNGLSPRALVQAIGQRVRGIEIDPFSAWASQVFLEASLIDLCRAAGARLPVVVEVSNSLLRSGSGAEYDLVIGNPPYGRVTLHADVRARFQRSLYGHANLYGLFTDLAVQLAKPGGVIAYVTPTSFLAGQYFKALRGLLAQEAPPVSIDFVSPRQGVFDDVLQETLLACYRRGGAAAPASVHFISPVDAQRIEVESAGSFSLPAQARDPWLIPRTAEQQRLIAHLETMRHRLRDYGYEVSTGPLVWNRHKRQLCARPKKGTLPLIWAECVGSDGGFRFRADKKNHQPYFQPRKGDDWLISRRPCILLQRTTAKEQSRRLIAAELPKEFVAEHGGVVIENHLNMVLSIQGAPRVSQSVLAALLNSQILDKVFRCFSGSVAVSAYELEALPLPPPDALKPLAQMLHEGAARDAIEAEISSLFPLSEPI